MNSTSSDIYVYSSNPQYNFRQRAKCIHCASFFKKPDKYHRYSTMWCSKHREYACGNHFACIDFSPNEKYVLSKNVQLNLFQDE